MFHVVNKRTTHLQYHLRRFQILKNNRSKNLRYTIYGEGEGRMIYLNENKKGHWGYIVHSKLVNQYFKSIDDARRFIKNSIKNGEFVHGKTINKGSPSSSGGFDKRIAITIPFKEYDIDYSITIIRNYDLFINDKLYFVLGGNAKKLDVFKEFNNHCSFMGYDNKHNKKDFYKYFGKHIKDLRGYVSSGKDYFYGMRFKGKDENEDKGTGLMEPIIEEAKKSLEIAPEEVAVKMIEPVSVSFECVCGEMLSIFLTDKLVLCDTCNKAYEQMSPLAIKPLTKVDCSMCKATIETFIVDGNGKPLCKSCVINRLSVVNDTIKILNVEREYFNKELESYDQKECGNDGYDVDDPFSDDDDY